MALSELVHRLTRRPTHWIFRIENCSVQAAVARAMLIWGSLMPTLWG